MALKNLPIQDLDSLANGPIDESFPLPLILPSEEVINSNRMHNAWIVIGRDRPLDELSGYGRFPKAQLGDKSTTIDIVVGRYSNKSGKDINGVKYDQSKIVGNNFQEDASRIYISQKTDIDDNFLITKAGTLNSARGKAAVGFKSDNIRVIARESIKLVAKCGEANSLGRMESGAIYGIQLITGVETEPGDVQGIVKSTNLKKCLDKIQEEISKLAGVVRDFITFQTEYNESVASHEHDGHFRSDIAGAVKVLDPIELQESLQKYNSQVNVKTLKSIDDIRITIEKVSLEYLTPAKSKTYIGSLYNRTN